MRRTARRLLELRTRLLHRRIVFERRRESLESVLVVLELARADARDLAAEHDALGGIGLARIEDLERFDELVPVAALFVNGLEDRRRFRLQLRMLQERFERGARTFVLRVHEQDLPIVLERP